MKNKIVFSDLNLSTGAKLLLPLILQLLFLSGFSQNLSISGGNGHSIMLCNNGSVYTMGNNVNGQLGTNGAPANSIVPIRVLRGAQPVSMNDGTNLGSIRQVDAGSGAHNVALACNGTVWCWGWNARGQVGDNTTVDRTVPAQVLTGAQGDPSGFLQNAIQVTAGNENTYALMSDGRVMGWGFNDRGQLADGTTTDKRTPVYVLTGPGTFLTNVVQIEGGDATGAALRSDGTVWTWGFNGNGQLGQNNTTTYLYATQVFLDAARTIPLTNIVSISAGDTHLLALAGDGSLWSWGGNWAGQLGYNTGGANSLLPKKVLLSASGPEITGVKSISAGNRHSMAVMNDGSLVTWGAVGGGSTYLGQTGTGAGTSYPTTVPLPGGTVVLEASDGDNWTFAVTSTGAIYAFGENTTNGYLGVNSTAATVPTPTAIPSLPCEVLRPCVDAFLGTDVVLCNPPSTTLYAPAGASTVKYRWKRDGVLLQDTSSSLFVNSAGTYRLIMWDSSYQNGCGYCPPDSDEVIISNSSPVIANDAGFCPDPCSSVTLSVTGPGGSNYDWYPSEFGGSPLNGVPSNSYTTPCLSTNTTYWVQDRSTQRCNAGYSYNQAPLSSPSSATSTNTATRMVFDVLTSFTLDTVTVAYNMITYGVCGGGASSTNNLFSVVVKNSGGTTLATYTPTVPCGSGIATVNVPIGYTFPVGTGYRLEFVTGPSSHSYVYFQNGANYATVPECGWINFVGSPTADTDDWPPFYNWRLRIGSNPCGRTPVQAFNNCVLPVNFSDFTATLSNGNVYMNWITLSESQNELFIIERSSDGIHFEAIGKVKGSGNTDYISSYNFIDSNPFIGISYYRIKQQDIDGKYSYSKVAIISHEDSQIVLYPNPFNASINIRANSLSPNHSIAVTDITGKVVAELTIQANEEYSFGENLPNGIYFISIIDEKQVKVFKIEKLK